MANIADIIKYEGDNSTFIWKHPCTMLAIESISATSNETEAAANELSKSVERQLHSVEELNEAVRHLQENALDLDTSVSIFKIE